MALAKRNGERSPAGDLPRLATSPFASAALQPAHLEQHPQQPRADQGDSEQDELTLPRDSKIQRWLTGGAISRVSPADANRGRQHADAPHVSLYVEVHAHGSAVVAFCLRLVVPVIQCRRTACHTTLGKRLSRDGATVMCGCALCWFQGPRPWLRCTPNCFQSRPRSPCNRGLGFQSLTAALSQSDGEGPRRECEPLRPGGQQRRCGHGGR